MLHTAGAVAQVDVEAAAVGLADRAVEAVGDQALRPLAPAAARQGRDGLAEFLAGGRQQRSELLLFDAQQLGDLWPRPVGQRHEGEGAHLERLQRRQRGRDLANGRRGVDATGGSGGHWSQRRALHKLDHNSPKPGIELRYGKPDQLSGELEGPWRTTPRTCSWTRSGWRTT